MVTLSLQHELELQYVMHLGWFRDLLIFLSFNFKDAEQNYSTLPKKWNVQSPDGVKQMSLCMHLGEATIGTNWISDEHWGVVVYGRRCLRCRWVEH